MKKDAFDKIDQHFRGYQYIVSILEPETVYEKRQSYLVKERQQYFDKKLSEFIEKNPSFGQRYIEKYGLASPSVIDNNGPRETALHFIKIGPNTIGVYGDTEGLKQIYDKHGWPFPQTDLIGPDGTNYGRGCSFTFQWAGIMFEEMKEMGWGVSEGYDIVFGEDKSQKETGKKPKESISKVTIPDLLSDPLEIPLNALVLPARAVNVLKFLGCKTLADIPQIEGPDALLKVRRCGMRTVYDIERFLNKINLRLGMSYDNIVEDVNIPRGALIIKRPTPNKKGELTESALITLDFVRQGYTIAAIARNRRLSVKTITLHIAKLIYAGEVDVLDFVDNKQYEEISRAVQNTGKRLTLRRIQVRCPRGTKRNAINLVLADLRRKQESINL